MEEQGDKRTSCPSCSSSCARRISSGNGSGPWFSWFASCRASHHCAFGGNVQSAQHVRHTYTSGLQLLCMIFASCASSSKCGPNSRQPATQTRCSIHCSETGTAASQCHMSDRAAATCAHLERVLAQQQLRGGVRGTDGAQQVSQRQRRLHELRRSLLQTCIRNKEG